MKKILRITGIVALAIVLVCNLEYALFSGDIKNTPNKALAAWDTGYTFYCGNLYDTSRFRGTWSEENSPAQFVNAYGYRIAVFTMNGNGYACAPNNGYFCCSDPTGTSYYYPQHYVTATTGWTSFGTP